MPTAAQGAKADSAQQPPSEGAFANGDKTKLDGITAGASTGTVTSVATSAPITGGTITTTGTIGISAATISAAGSMSGADKTKLDGIEASATADQSNAEIRAAVEAATDSNVFTDADHTKLNGIEASATADQTNAEIRAAVEAATDSNVFTDADHTKLNGIEASADVTDTANVVAALTAGTNITIAADGTIASSGGGGGTAPAIEDNSGTPVFATGITKAELHTLLNIEDNADVTDTANVTAAGALMDSEVTNLAQVKAFNTAAYATAAQGCFSRRRFASRTRWC